MRRAKLLVALAVAFAGCAHTGLKKVSDCDQAPVEQRLQCAACTVKNDVPGSSDSYEYRPDNDPASRCVKSN
jgi:hypothetical protein